jgi:hypothetical protein
LKIAIVVPRLWYSDNTAKFSANLGIYIQAIVGLGHQPLLVCLEGSEYHVDFPVQAVPELEMVRSGFWRGLGLDAALVFTWMRHVPLLQAMKAADIFVVSKGDTEGRISARVFPAHHFRMMQAAAHTPWEKACTVRHWLRRRLFLEGKSDREVMANIALADRVAVDTHSAKCHLEQHLAFYGKSVLADKLFILPPPLAEDFLTAPLMQKNRNKIAAVGRWDDPVKDAPLLAKTLSLYLSKQPETEVVLIGGGGASVFDPLCRRYPKMTCLGSLPRWKMVQALSDTQVLLMTSRGESFHFASHEALCLGATVVGPKSVTPLPDICREGPFGKMAVGRRPSQLAAALEEEMAAWGSGKRFPAKIAAHWRPRLYGTHTIQQILDLIPPKRS